MKKFTQGIEQRTRGRDNEESEMKNNSRTLQIVSSDLYRFVLVWIAITYIQTQATAGILLVSNSSGDNTMSNIQKQTTMTTEKGMVESKPHSNGASNQMLSKSASSNFEAPRPFTADELWEKILKLVELPDGYISKEQVESVFGVTLKLDEEYLKKFHGHLYSLKTQFIYLGFIENSATESHFKFEWGQTSGQRYVVSPRPPSGMCINAFKIMPSIAQRGWELTRESRNVRDLLDRNDYRKGKMGVLQMEFFPRENCMAKIDIFTDKLADQFFR